MIAHVAEASEASGRVVLWLSPASHVSAAAIEASARVAAAYGSEIETVVVSAGPLPAAADGPVPMRRVMFSRQASAAVAVAIADGAMPDASALMARRQQREAERAASRLNIACRHAHAEGDPFDRLAEMCQARGPWNIVGLTEQPSVATGHVVSSILANVAGATGVVVAPATDVSKRSRVTVVIEDMDRMPSMLRAAERLSAGRGKVHVLIAETTRTAYDELETAVRLLTEGRPNIVFDGGYPTFAVEGALDFSLRRLAPGFVIARFGGALLPTARVLARTITLTGAPFLLVR